MATRLIANTGRTTGMATGLSAIFFQNRAALLRFLRARGAGEDAEDLLQDMWMKLEAKDLGPLALMVYRNSRFGRLLRVGLEDAGVLA